MIGAGQTIGMKRQVFMVSMGGFDTHANQMRDQPVLMARVAQSIDYFMNAMRTMGLLDNVTLFTASDFGRTLNSNGDGSDHGWGSAPLHRGRRGQGRHHPRHLPRDGAQDAAPTSDQAGCCRRWR